MGTIANIVSGKPLATGGVLRAPLGSTAPDDAVTALDAAFKAAGYIGEDGLTETADRQTNKVKAWGGDVVKILQTDYSVTYQFTFLETINQEVLEAVHGADNVEKDAPTPTTGTLYTVKLNSDVLPHESYVFEVKDGKARIRIYVPDGQITEVGEIKYTDGEVIGYQVTLEAFRDSVADANAVKFIDDGVFSA